ncbi:MAG TPA: hypothetical protein VHS36_09435, partial [Candidatus Limnocylindrales bacterium]|nr:hypothetical protein [Candidatus Limnocylindrales bacterium]
MAARDLTDAEPRVAPFGSWESPFPIDLLTRGTVALAEVQVHDGVGYWLEGRPDEQGRQVLVRRGVDGEEVRLSPDGFNVRTRVHEYGGGAYAVDGELVVVSDFTTGRLHRVTAPGQLAPITPEGRAWRFADLSIDRFRNRILAIREDHEPDTLARHGEAENAVVAIDLASGEVSVLVDGSDFFSSPRQSPDGRRMAWLRWNHPNMPWDGTELVVADLDPAGRPSPPRVVAGSATDWIAQPRWSPQGVLHFAAEPDGWMNLFRLADGDRVERATPQMEAEFAFPDWAFGIANYAFEADGSIVAVGRAAGRDSLYRFVVDREPTRLDVPWTEMSYLAVDGGRVLFRAASPVQPWAIVELDIETASHRPIRPSSSTVFEPAEISPGRLVEFPTTGARTSFGLCYAPHNRRFRGPDGQPPPL